MDPAESTCKVLTAHQCRYHHSVAHLILTVPTLQGDFTALASEPYCVCGIDVAAPHQLHRPAPAAAGAPLWPAPLDVFRSQFSAAEWAEVQSHAGDEGRMDSCFQRFWSLKEVGGVSVFV